MKTLTVRLPDELAARLDAEARARRVSRSDIVRERLQTAGAAKPADRALASIADVVGSVKSLPADLSRRKKAYLKATGYGRRHR